MPGINRIFRFEEPPHPDSVMVMSDRISLAEGQRKSVETLTRVVTFDDPYYGTVRISHDLLQEIIGNFDANTYGQDIAIDVAHRPQDGAAGFIRRLFLDGSKLRAEIEWTPYGIDAVHNRGFRYFSAEFTENYRHPETGQKHGALLMGAGLTTRPRVKGLDPADPNKLSLSFDADERGCAVSPRMRHILTEEITTMWEKLIKRLQEKLQGMKLAEDLNTQMVNKFTESVNKITDEDTAKALMEAFVTAAENIPAASGNSGTVTLDFSGLTLPASNTGVSEDDVKRLMAEAQENARQALQQSQESLDKNIQMFSEALEAEEGLKALSEDQMAVLLSAKDLITADMTDAQVKSLSENQIRVGQQMAISVQLSQRGFPASPSGSVHVEVENRDDSKKLSEMVRGQLQRTSIALTGALRLPEKSHPFADMVLAEFDRLHAPAIHAEVKYLAGGSTAISDTDLPVSFKRQVILEALHDLRVLELVMTAVDPTATVTTQIPYEERDASAIRNGGIVYEGQPIHRASVAQKMDTAYILPMKLAMIVSNEVMHFSRSSAINWDAFARNVESNARIMRELIVARICNELQRASDAYAALDITNEDLDAQLDGSTSTVKTAEFPIVRPHQARDLNGNDVGSLENPITVRLNGSEIQAYDGSGDQSAGTYYRVTNYNLGYVQFVDESGDPATPSSTGSADDISYSYATNVQKFDLDVPGGSTLEQHLNGLLRAIGARKAVLDAERFVQPEYLLMSSTLNDTATNAEAFAAMNKRDGSDTTAMGDLSGIKGVPSWKTNVPGVDLGDERILMGPRGQLGYTIAKPFVTGAPFEATDPTTGKPTGQKQAYGEEYSAIKMPTPVRNRHTSVIAYSASSR